MPAPKAFNYANLWKSSIGKALKIEGIHSLWSWLGQAFSVLSVYAKRRKEWIDREKSE
jgi:hypothetical protein